MCRSPSGAERPAAAGLACLAALALALALALAGCATAERSAQPAATAPPPIAAAAPDRWIGVYVIEVSWQLIEAGGPKAWTGEVCIERKDGDRYVGKMRLRCTTMRWTVDQDIVVEIDGDDLLIQGSNVREVEVPEGRGGYGWDVFRLRRDGKVWLSGQASGENDTKGSVRMYRADLAAACEPGAAG